MKLQRLMAGVALYGLVLLADTGYAAEASSTLTAVRSHGFVTCGVSGNAAGFSLPDSKGVMRGIDADMCRIVASAVFGDAAKVKYVAVAPSQRLTALQSGEVDVLAANLTWTMTRETQSGLEFAALEYYDGEGFMVAKKLNVTSAKQMNGASICMLSGSSEGTAQEYFGRLGVKFRPVVFSDGPELRTAFLSGRCDVYQTDASTLANFKASLGPKSNDYVILPELAGKEPLGIAVRKGDDKWFDIVRWTFFATLSAEEAGISSKNVSGSTASQVPAVRRLLGLDGDMGQSLGLDNKWAYNIIAQVGNYAEIWDRSFGPTGVPRGYNRLWRDGGLMYAPPMR
ncbi:amino acid ABC transporter substrate-binding protein [Caballeronia sp. LjRoot34]|uniref:amino acid ABC transporter substrate-binding protein n=1 Tax=Caballeronia sp. LjRoot34 TaxID=3342325 RepID=UPI003ED11950